MLAEARPAVVDSYLLVRGLHLHVQRRGDPSHRAVVLIHGGGANLHWWDHLATILASSFNVIAIDLRGHGDSEHASPPAYSLADYRDDVVAIIHALALPTFALVGHSLGAVIAAQVALGLRQRLDRLVLVDSQARLSAASARYLAKLRFFPQPIYANQAEAVRRFRLLPKPTTATREQLALIAANSLRFNPDGSCSLKLARDTLAQLQPVDLVPELASLGRPLLLVRGEHSVVLPRDRLQALLGDLPRAVGAEIANAHHHVMLDNPHEFDRVVADFLTQQGTD